MADSSQYQRLVKHPSVFSRGALEMSFKLLRKSKPTVALIIQNCLAQPPIVAPFRALGQKEIHHFQLNLDEQDLNRIIGAMEEKLSGPLDQGQQAALTTLLNDWLNYAAWMSATENP